MKILTGPIKGLHSMRHNSVVIDTTHGLIQFSHLTMQLKIAASKTSETLQSVLIGDALTIPPRTTKTITDNAMTRTRKCNQNGKRMPRWRSRREVFPQRNSQCPSTQKNF